MGESSTKEEFDRRRAVELKHGRVCMAACLGMLWPDVFGKFDGYLSPSEGLQFSDVPPGFYAIYKVPLFGWLQILLLAGVMETKLFGDKSFGGFAYGKYGAEPGNFGTGYWGRKIQDPTERRTKLTAELNNGRLAMVAFTGMIVQNGLTGQSPIEQLQSGHISPFNDGQGFFAVARRAGEQNSLALPWAPCPPSLKNDVFGDYVGDVGFDPLGFSQNARLLPWYREAELAHGRVCMLATLGFTIQKAGVKIEPFVTKYPTSSDDALLAATQVPVVGWLQILTLITLTELWRYENVISKYDSGVKPGDLGWNQNAPVSGSRPKWFGPTFTAKYSNEEFDQLRLREIKHARLAMFGFAFMAVQNAITGSTPSLFFLSFEKPEYVTPVGDFIPKNL